MNKTTHFGFETISEQDKARRVAGVFTSVADNYDLMNDIMSAGLHRVWKRFAVSVSGVREGQRVLDVAGGSADLSRLFLKKVGSSGQVVLTDINNAMLRVGRDRLMDEGYPTPVTQCDAEHLPFPDNYFDCVSIAFGLRNVTHKDAALRDMFRVLKPGGRLIVLEFSKIAKPLEKIYDVYSLKLLPKIGQFIAKDADSYRYLAESIRMHPGQEELKQMMEAAGLEKVEYFDLTAGVVAVHRG
ncbi:MAG: bifunctional demethylmenaquinone methyltransferase/2-methoxy-6-polyprenyl-1,4-benzoquinol methylase UbiE, partial [Gallionella sp.]